MMRVERFSSKLEDKLNKYIVDSENSSFFQSRKYLHYIKRHLSCREYSLVAFDENNDLRGYLPILGFIEDEKLVLNSLPYYGSNGGIIAENKVTARLLLESFFNYYPRRDILCYTLVSSPFNNHDFSEVYESFLGESVDYRIGQYTELSKIDFSEDMASFHYKTRNAVRKGQKGGFDISHGQEYFDELYAMHSANMSAIGGKPKRKDFFESLEKNFDYGDDYKIWIARYEGEIVCALLLFYYKQFVEYFTPAVCHKFRNSQVLSCLIFESMFEAHLSGYKIWNWGGTWQSQEGVYRFKNRWGTTNKKYNYYNLHLDIIKSTNCNFEGFYTYKY